MSIADLGFSTFDLVLLAIVLISALVGILRGLIREMLSLLSWIVAIWLAFKYAPQAAEWLGPYLKAPQLEYVIALVVVFILCLLLFSLCAIILVKLLSLAGVSGTDRTLGAVFGIVRGIAILLVIVFLLRLSPAADQSWFQSSQLVPYFDPVFEYLDRRGFNPPVNPGIEIPLLPSN